MCSCQVLNLKSIFLELECFSIKINFKPKIQFEERLAFFQCTFIKCQISFYMTQLLQIDKVLLKIAKYHSFLYGTVKKKQQKFLDAWCCLLSLKTGDVILNRRTSCGHSGQDSNKFLGHASILMRSPDKMKASSLVVVYAQVSFSHQPKWLQASSEVRPSDTHPLPKQGLKHGL